MARPFRFAPPRAPNGVAVKSALLDLVRPAPSARLLTVVAGPGFGKTILLAAARTCAEQRGDRAVWLTCEPGDVAADHLRAGLLAAYGEPAVTDLDGLHDAVWALAPQRVCIVIDDLHEVASGSDGAALLGRLLVDLPGNAHLLVGSRADPPVPVARLAASGQLVRVTEVDLLLGVAELRALARARGVEPEVLASTGGWPALAELTASAGADLVMDYLWEEVLERVGPERAALLARFAVVGGGDDQVASALAGRDVRVEDLLADVPLVQRRADGAAVLHPLWSPTLRDLLDGPATDDARRRAAGVHRTMGGVQEAMDLLAESADWDEVLTLLRAVAVDGEGEASPEDFRRWHRLLPVDRRTDPTAALVDGLALQHHAPVASVPSLESAAAGYRTAGDVDGEAAAISAHGLVLWWANDLAGLLPLHERVTELGPHSAAARYIRSVGLAAVAHLLGDSDGVRRSLAEAEVEAAADDAAQSVVRRWFTVAQWFRSVAHRRDGDLARSLDALEEVGHPDALPAELTHARLRTRWLAGEVDEVVDELPALRRRFEEDGLEVSAAGVELEMMGKGAWLGDPDGARSLIGRWSHAGLDQGSPMARAMELIIWASVAVADGDEERACDVLRDEATRMVGVPGGWYWRDRGALALVHVLVPETRPGWANEPLGPPHLVGLALAEALEASRAGRLEELRRLSWPPAGVVRAHLPLPWVIELMAAGRAADNPPPAELSTAVERRLRAALRSLVASGQAGAAVVAAAEAWLGELPVTPPSTVRIGLLGPLEVDRAGTAVGDPLLRRQRVRELLSFLVVRRRCRREEVAAVLWPDHDQGRNLRVTLSYLQRVLEPGRAHGAPPYHLRSDGPWLHLSGGDRLEVDLWELEDLLDEAARAERAGQPASALDAYGRALPLWRGEPLADVPYSDWAQVERSRLLGRYLPAALRAAELLLADNAADEAAAAATRAITADPTSEAAYRLLARARLAAGDAAGARSAQEACRASLAELGLEPATATWAG